MNIWLFSLFDPTPIDNMRPYRYMGIALAGLKMGHNITLFSSTLRHSTRVKRFEKTTATIINENYEVIYIHAKSYKKNVSINRMLSHWQYTKNLKLYIKKLPSPDLILVALPPLSLAFFLTRWAKKNKIPITIDIIDPWPEAFLRLSPKPLKFVLKLILFPLYYKLRSILKRTNGIIGISNEYVSWAKNYGYPNIKTEVFLPAVPYNEIRGKFKIISEKVYKNKSDKLTLIYAGSLGISYDIPVILEASEIINKRYPDQTEFVIAGTGIHLKLINEYISRCNNIKYLGYQYYDDLIYQYALADVALTQYSSGATQSVTYKFFDCLSAGLPLLNSLMSEMAVLTDQYKVGLNNPPGDVGKLVENIETFLFNKSLLEEYKKNALALASSKGDSEIVYQELINFLLSFK
ncbi:MAG: glycosyltransferase [Bacteroidales bacterium]|nr:glycosyltransferase [Bacteroidales bacterium]MCF8390253.1 glycosyltransferase [Bacteroidales bacterium]